MERRGLVLVSGEACPLKARTRRRSAAVKSRGPKPLQPLGNGSKCVRCLAGIDFDEFNRNDGACDKCAAEPDQFSMRSDRDNPDNSQLEWRR